MSARYFCHYGFVIQSAFNGKYLPFQNNTVIAPPKGNENLSAHNFGHDDLVKQSAFSGKYLSFQNKWLRSNKKVGPNAWD